MLRLHADQVEMLWDPLLPVEVTALPDNLARLDRVLSSEAILAPFREHWQKSRVEATGRPTIPMATYVRLMLVKQRTKWGYETLMREVSDSFHLRRFCLIPLTQSVPDESTVRKLTRRLGPEVVNELIRGSVRIAMRERHFRPRALRVDSTVVQADIRYPTDAGLAADAVRVLARIAREVLAAVPELGERVRDRSRSVGRRLRELGRTLKRRTGEAKAEVQRLTEAAAAAVTASVREARKLVEAAKRCPSRAQGVSRAAKARAIARLEETIARAERVVEQVGMRFAGEPIPNRLVSLFDPDARPVRRGKLHNPTEFGYVTQFAEVTAHTRHGARGLLLPPQLQAGSTHENTLLPGTVAELANLGIRPKEAAFDGGFVRSSTEEALAEVGSPELFIAGNSANAGSRRTRRRRARFRVGCEGRISHLKRGYGAGRSRLKGEDGAMIWEGWATLAYNADTVAGMEVRSR